MATDAGLAKLLSSNVECRNCALEYAYLSPNLSNDYQSLESSKLSKVAFKDYGIELVQTNGGAVCTAAWEAGQYGTSCVVSQIKGKPTAVHVIFTPAKPKVAANCEAATGLSLYKVCPQFPTQVQTKLMLKSIVDDGWEPNAYPSHCGGNGCPSRP